MSALQDAIHEYSNRGFNVIPLAPNSKSPEAGFPLEKYSREKYPVQALLEIAGKRPINLGIMTGKTSGLAVIDVDIRDKVLGYLSQYPTGLAERTPKKQGAHLYYEYREGLPELLKIADGEFYAGGTRYMVATPSVFEGKQYEWIKQGDLGKLPQALFTEKTSLQTGKYTRKEIYDLINEGFTLGIRDGQWNDTVLYGAMVLASDGMTEPAINALMDIINRGEEPIPEKQVRSMVRRAMEYAEKDTYQKELPKGKQAQEHNINLAIESYEDVGIKYQNYQESWLVEGWMMESAVMAMAAPPERYKTWISVDLALSVASGLMFLDTYPVTKTGNVLILQQEDFGPRYFSRFKTIERAKLERAALPVTLSTSNGVTIYESSYNISNKIFFHSDAEFTLDNDMAIDKLEQRIVETGAILCIIDPFYSLSSSEDYFASIAEKIRARLKTIRNKTGCAFLFVHHNRKSGTDDSGDKLDRSQMFGSQFVNAVMEGTWMVGRMKGMGNTQVKVKRSFKDADAEATTVLTFHINTKTEDDAKAYVVDVQDETEDLSNEVIKWLRDNGAQNQAALYKAFEDRFSSKSAFVRWISNQVGQGINQDGKRGKYSVEPDES